MESAKQERIRVRKAATAAKRDSNREIEKEKSRIWREADQVTSQEHRQQKQKQHPVPSRLCQESRQKQQNNEQQTRRNQLIHQQTQERARKHEQHLKAKHA